MTLRDGIEKEDQLAKILICNFNGRLSSKNTGLLCVYLLHVEDEPVSSCQEALSALKDLNLLVFHNCFPVKSAAPQIDSVLDFVLQMELRTVKFGCALFSSVIHPHLIDFQNANIILTERLVSEPQQHSSDALGYTDVRAR